MNHRNGYRGRTLETHLGRPDLKIPKLRLGSYFPSFLNPRKASIQEAAEVERMLDALMARKWGVYSKPSIQRTETVVRYLARYSHRIALSDRHLLHFDGQRVTLVYKDYRDGKDKVLALDAEELIRRFLLHVLPKGFMRIRHYGFLADRCRTQCLGRIQEAIADQKVDRLERKARIAQRTAAQETRDPADPACPRCHKRRLQVVGAIDPKPSPRPCTTQRRRSPGGEH